MLTPRERRWMEEIESKLDAIIENQKKQNKKLEKIDMTIQELEQKLTEQNAKLDEISTDLVEGFAEITALIGQLQNQDLPPEAADLVDQLEAKVNTITPQAQALADIVPGSPPTPNP